MVEDHRLKHAFWWLKTAGAWSDFVVSVAAIIFCPGTSTRDGELIAIVSRLAWEE